MMNAGNQEWDAPSPMNETPPRNLPGELFHTADQIAYADFVMNGRRQCWPVQSDAFRRLLRLKVYEDLGKAPSAAELTRWVGLLEAKALHDSPEHEVFIRVACIAGRIYIDLADRVGGVVEIGADGWRVVHDAPVHFVRVPGMLPLPAPENGGSIQQLRSLINVATEDDFILIVAWLLAALRNEGPHPLLVLSGGEGTAKTFLVAILAPLIDPSSTPLQGLPRTERQLVAHYLLSFDNVSAISVLISDALCRISSAGGHPIIINGIDSVVTRPDLADRSLFVSCDFIPENQRRSEQQLWAAFENARPRILGALFDALSVGLRRLPDIHPDRLPRMADFALLATACESALWPSGTFFETYSRNRAAAAEMVIDADIVASAVRKLMEDWSPWKGTATELLVAMQRTFEAGRKSNAPQSARALAGRLRSATPSLSKVGITVRFDVIGHKRDRIIRITRDADVAGGGAPSAPSASAPSADEQFVSSADGNLGAVADDAAPDLEHDAAAEPSDRNNKVELEDVGVVRSADDADVKKRGRDDGKTFFPGSPVRIADLMIRRPIRFRPPFRPEKPWKGTPVTKPLIRRTFKRTKPA
jgi:hypothetical protein